MTNLLYILGYDPGSVHRWAALLELVRGKTPRFIGEYNVGAEREDVADILDRTIGRCKMEPDARLAVAVETPRGVPFGKDVREVKARGRDTLATALAAERFASVAWARGYEVHQYAASDVRAHLCLAKAATDAEVAAALRANVVGIGSKVHARDAQAVALFTGALIIGQQVKHTADLVRAKAATRRKVDVKRLEPSVLRAMKEQGLA